MATLKFWNVATSQWEYVRTDPTPLAKAKSTYVPNTNPDISATSWAPLPTNPCVVTLDEPLPIGTIVMIEAHAWMVATTAAGDVRAAIQCSGGATLAAGAPVGHTLYKIWNTNFTTTEMMGMALLVTITDDQVPLTVEMYAQQSGRAAANQRAINYPGISVVPLHAVAKPSAGEGYTYSQTAVLTFPNTAASNALTLPLPPPEYPQTKPDAVQMSIMGGTAFTPHVVSWSGAQPNIQARRDDGTAYNGTREVLVTRFWNR